MRTSLPRFVHFWFSYIVICAHVTLPVRTVEVYRWVYKRYNYAEDRSRRL
jgi:hypothetical protein